MHKQKNAIDKLAALYRAREITAEGHRLLLVYIREGIEPGNIMRRGSYQKPSRNAPPQNPQSRG